MCVCANDPECGLFIHSFTELSLRQFKKALQLVKSNLITHVPCSVKWNMDTKKVLSVKIVRVKL